MTETPPEKVVEEQPETAGESKGYALYDTAELRYLEGIYPSAREARAAHKDSLVERRTYEARKV